MKQLRAKGGFTLVELIIAMAVFSMAIVVLTISFIGLVRAQRTASEDRESQQNARTIVEDIVKDIRASTSVTACTVDGKEALLLAKEVPVLYFRSTGNQMLRANLRSPSCPAGAPGDSETLTSRVVTAETFDIAIISDAPTPENLKSVAVDINLVLKSGDSTTFMRTVGATRGGL